MQQHEQHVAIVIAEREEIACFLDECWRPSFARYPYIRYQGLKADLAAVIHTYNTDRAHTGRITQGRIPADILGHKMRPRA
jgi:hypothetical protein